MEKRSSYKRDSIVEDNEFFDNEIVEEEYHYQDQVKLEPPASVWLQCIYPATVIVTGITGKRYVFNGSNSVLEVDAIDVPKLMAKKFNQTSCCGAANPTSKFRIL